MSELIKKIISITATVLILAFFAYAQYMELQKYYNEILPTRNIESEINQTDQSIKYSESSSKDQKDGDNQENNQENNDESNLQNNQENNQGNNDVHNNGNNQTDSTQNQNQEKLSLYALSALLMDAKNGRVLYEKNGYNQMAMASTTKIMTCLVALEEGNLEDVVTVSKYASTMPDVQLNIREGDQFILGDLLFSLMLESHNDVAVAIAEHIGGSVEGFATLMNEKAKELGCTNTNFVTPNGLDADGHYTTAYDLALIASYAIKNKDFIKITNTPNWEFKELTNGRTYAVSNKDRFLYMMDGAIGIKTGFTSKAGYCFVGAVDSNDKTFVSVVLGSGWPPNKNYKWRDTTTLMNYGCNSYSKKKIVDQRELPKVYVNLGQIAYTNLHHYAELELLLKEDEVVTITYYLPKTLTAPIKKDTIVGRAEYFINDRLYTTVPIYVDTSVEKVNFQYYLDQILSGIWRMF